MFTTNHFIWLGICAVLITILLFIALKKKFSVPLSEIKEFCSRDKILLGIGNSIIVDEYRKEIEQLGGKIETEEIDR